MFMYIYMTCSWTIHLYRMYFVLFFRYIMDGGAGDGNDNSIGESFLTQQYMVEG